MKVRHILTVLTALLLLAPPAEARRISTRTKAKTSGNVNRKKGKSSHLKSTTESETVCIVCTDSAQGDLINMIRFAGFDKKAQSRKESFFICNSSGHTLRGVEINLTYTTLDGRELHSREKKIECEVPPGTSRNVTVPTWDTQNSFYYYRSQAPRKGVYTPFEVTIRPLRFTFDRIPSLPLDSVAGK